MLLAFDTNIRLTRVVNSTTGFELDGIQPIIDRSARTSVLFSVALVGDSYLFFFFSSFLFTTCILYDHIIESFY